MARKIFLKVLLLLTVLTIIGCSIGVKRSFLATQGAFNDSVESYYAYYQSVTPEEQAKLKAEVTPLVIEALLLVESMNAVVRMGSTPSTISEKSFRDLRYELYKKLPNIFKKGD